jgi:predicted esterase YcpF (UPF0227 family)
MILNIHGYQGCSRNAKYLWLEETYDDLIISEQMDYDKQSPKGIIEGYSRIIDSFLERQDRNGKTNNSLTIVGTSLGGFITLALHCIYPNSTAILFNPALTPFLLLQSEGNRELILEYVDIFCNVIYKNMETKDLYIFLGSHDERIDHQKLTKPVLPTNFKSYHYTDQPHHIEIDQGIEDTIIENNYIKSSLKKSYRSGGE